MHFEISLNGDDTWGWTIRNVSGHYIASSIDTYITKSECIESIESVRESLLPELVFDLIEEKWLHQ